MRRRLVVVGASLGLFGLLAFELEVAGPGGFVWERRLTHLLVKHSSDRPVSDSMHMSHYFADWRGLAALTVVLAALALLAGRGRDALLLAFSTLAVALTLPLKVLFGRPPPLGSAAEPSSFPSGHAIGTMALAAAVVTVLWGTRLRWLAVLGGAVFAAAIGVAVVAEQGHWPSDVLAGWALAGAWVAAISSVVRTPTRQSPRAKSLGRLGQLPPS